MDRKTDLPDSDETARKKHANDADEGADVDLSSNDAQTSNKTGKHSSVEKLAASRPEFGTGAGAKPVDGAFGDGEENRNKGKRGGSPETS